MFVHSYNMITAYQLWFLQNFINGIEPEKQVIVGAGVKVQTNESKFAKRKYHRVHSVGDDSCFFGGIDANNNWFVVVVEDGKESTSLPIIQQYITTGVSHQI